MTVSIGEKLHLARVGKGLSIEQASHETFIKPHYLEALESGDFSRMPSAVQVRGFLRSYADYLGLDSAQLLRRFQETQASPSSEPDIQPAPPPSGIPPTQKKEAAPTPPKRVAQADELFAQIGQTLRGRRDLLGLNLNEVADHTHIPLHYVESLESGNFDGFPSPAQARGMLANYAAFLDLDPERLLVRFAEGLQAEFAVRRASQEGLRPRRLPHIPPLIRNLISADLIFAAVLAVAVIVFLVWGVNRITATQAGQAATPTAPSLAEVLLPSPTPTITPSPTPFGEEGAVETGAPIETEATLVATDEGIVVANPGTLQLSILVLQRTWFRITVDGEVAYDGRALPGENYTYTAEERIELLTGNGASLRVSFNGQDLGPLGIYGEVVNLIYTADGILTPTGTLAPTPLPVTGTPTPTNTAIPSPTAPSTPAP